mgnify:CR=1 FL=1
MEDPLRPARGFVWGLLASILLWACIAGLIAFVVIGDLSAIR